MALPFLALVVMLAPGQDSPKPVNLNPLIQVVELDQVDIRAAVQRLSADSGVQIRVDKEVRGTVTAYLRRVSLNVALQNVMKQVDGGFEVRDGAYTAFVNSAGPSKQRIEVLDLDGAEAGFALKRLFDLTTFKYEIAKDVSGKVKVEFENVPFELALRTILNSVGGDYQVKKGVYYIQNGPVYKAR